MKPVTQQTAVELLALLREAKISPLELADEYIAQIQRLNPQLNALVDFDPERVREQVRAADRSRTPRGIPALWIAGYGEGIHLGRRPSLRNRQRPQPRQ